MGNAEGGDVMENDGRAGYRHASRKAEAHPGEHEEHPERAAGQRENQERGGEGGGRQAFAVSNDRFEPEVAAVGRCEPGGGESRRDEQEDLAAVPSQALSQGRLRNGG